MSSQNTNRKSSNGGVWVVVRNYGITAAIGLIAAVVIMCCKSVFSQTDVQIVMQILSDSFLIPGVCLAGVGLLTLASHGGTYDMLFYALHLIKSLFSKREAKKYKDFYDYESSKEGKKGGIAHLLIVGIVMILIAVLFLVLYYRV